MYVRSDAPNVAAPGARDGVFAKAVGPAVPRVIPNFTGIQLPTVWEVSASVEHYWTPALGTSLYGSVTSWDPGPTGNASLCPSPDQPAGTEALAATKCAAG